MTDLAIIGEVHTSLLQTSAPLSPEQAASTLRLLPGEAVRSQSRPVAITWSPEQLAGVDCLAPLPPSARRARLVGTLRSVASVSGGRVLQVSTWTQVRYSEPARRRRWSHYLAEPGTVELLTPVRGDVLAGGFLAGQHTEGALDIAAAAGDLLSQVQASASLNRDAAAPFAVPRTQLRWAAREPEEDRQHADLIIGEYGRRSLALEIPAPLGQAAAEFCADLALHDWLLSGLQDIAGRALGGADPPLQAVPRLGRVLSYLAPVWMPQTRVAAGLGRLWAALEQQTRMSDQWNAATTQARDYLSARLADGLLAASARLSGLAELPDATQER